MELAWIWIPIAIFAALMQSVRTAAQKTLNQNMSTMGTTYVRSLFGMPTLIVFLAAAMLYTGHGIPAYDPVFLLHTAVAALTQVLATALLIYMFRLKNFAIGTMLTKTDIIMTALIGTALFSEQLTQLGWVALVVVVCGTILMLVGKMGTAAFRESGVTARMKKARMEIVGLRADGTEFPLESTIAQVTIGGQTMFTAILRDISERRRAEDELRESNRQLRELATSLQAVREEERTAIARELHDELGQQLLRLRMDLSWLEGRLKDLAPALHEKVAGMKDFVAATVDVLRHVTTQLRPPLLDDLGLAEAARWQLDEFAQRTGIAVISSIAIGDMGLDQRTAINVFRILQESLTNVARHAGATQVNVSLARTAEGLALDIRDNGCGTELRDKPDLGHGLVGIRERTLLLGGQMEIASAPGEGFTLRVRIPLLAPESAGEEK